MTRTFFGKTFFSHGVFTAQEAETLVGRAKAAGLEAIARKRTTGVEVFVK